MFNLWYSIGAPAMRQLALPIQRPCPYPVAPTQLLWHPHSASLTHHCASFMASFAATSSPPRDVLPTHTDFLLHHDATHARLVSALVHVLFGLGFRRIRTDAHPTRTSTALGEVSHCHDVEACSGHDARALFAVETTTSLATERAALRLRALATAADGHELWLAVPTVARQTALRRLRELQIPARVIGV